MLDTGQYGAGLVRVPAETHLPASVRLQANRRPRCILTREPTNDAPANICLPIGCTFHLGWKLEKLWYSQWAYSPDVTAYGQRPWTSCGCQHVTPLPLQHTQSSGLLPVYVLLGRKCAHLRDSPFLVAPMCSTIRKIYRFIKMVTGRKVSSCKTEFEILTI
jgi:hypothetical protein